MRCAVCVNGAIGVTKVAAVRGVSRMLLSAGRAPLSSSMVVRAGCPITACAAEKPPGGASRGGPGRAGGAAGAPCVAHCAAGAGAIGAIGAGCLTAAGGRNSIAASPPAGRVSVPGSWTSVRLRFGGGSSACPSPGCSHRWLNMQFWPRAQ